MPFTSKHIFVGFAVLNHYDNFLCHDSKIQLFALACLIFLDVPMSVGILNIRSKGTYTNELEFEWDTKIEAQIYVKVRQCCMMTYS